MVKEMKRMKKSLIRESYALLKDNSYPFHFYN